MMSSPRDPRALKIRGALLDRGRHSQTTSNFQVLFWAPQRHREVVFFPSNWQENEVMFFWCGLKKQCTRTCSLLQLNLPGMLIQSRDWRFQEVKKVGQEKLLFDLQWPGSRERRKMRRRRVMGPGLSPKTVSTAHLSENQWYYTTNSHNRTLKKLQFLLHTLSWAWIFLFD